MKSLKWTLLIFGATISSLLVALAGSDRVSPSRLLLFAALCLTAVGIALTIRQSRQAPVRVSSSLYGIDPDPRRPRGAMFISRGHGRRRR